MFKQIFENKIGEKLNTFNNSGKVAFEWMDKFRQSLDITEKIQQQFNNTSVISNNNNQNEFTVNNEQNDFNLNRKASISTSHMDTSFSQNKRKLKHTNSITSNQNVSFLNSKKEEQYQSTEYLNNSSSINKQHENENFNFDFNQSMFNQQQQTMQASPTISPSNSAFASPKNSVKSNNLLKSNFVNSIQQSNESNEFSLSSSSSLSQKSTDYNLNNQQQQQNNNQSLRQSNSIAEEHLKKDTLSLKGSSISNSNKTLVRQSTDLTSSFPLKPFQKINSETVEIPGLNVKVVRYRIENDLGKIEPHLYINYNSGGIESTTPSKGKLYFSLRYNEDIQSFSITINKAEIYTNNSNNTQNTSQSSLSLNVSSKSHTNHKPDTYVKIQLLPDKKRKYQTKIQRKNHQPVFEETFYFQLPFEELQNKILYLAFLEFGRFSKHELIGAVRIGDLNLIKDLRSSEVEFSRNVLPLADDDLELGELTLTLCYLPAAGRLTVTIVKAINLKAMDINGKSDPYVKVTLITKGKRLKKKKTSVMKNTLNPVYNESMLFDILQDQIEQVDMLVKVIDYDRVGSNELIGCIGIGPSFSGIGRDHWYRMLENPRKPITQSYYLKDSSFLREGLPAKVQKALCSDKQESTESRQD